MFSALGRRQQKEPRLTGHGHAPVMAWKYTPRDTRISVSAVLSIHNRSELFRRALDGYLWQTMPRERWEIVLVDDMSTEDLSASYRHLLGRVNIRHIKIDHRRHPVWKARNQGWSGAGPEDWFHTPAITTNVGVSMARGDVVCICHPEVLHAPTNFEIASAKLRRRNAYLFGTTYLGTAETNDRLRKSPDWTSLGWPGFLESVGAPALQSYGHECYW